MKHFIGVVICILAVSIDFAYSATATCDFGSVNGKVVFEETGGYLQAKVLVHAVDSNSAFKIHVHESAPTSGCNGLGGHFNIGDDGVDEGDIQPDDFLSDASGHLHTEYYHVPALSLNGDDNGVAGRGIAIHNSDGQKILCCGIVED